MRAKMKIWSLQRGLCAKLCRWVVLTASQNRTNSELMNLTVRSHMMTSERISVSHIIELLDEGTRTWMVRWPVWEVAWTEVTTASVLIVYTLSRLQSSTRKLDVKLPCSKNLLIRWERKNANYNLIKRWLSVRNLPWREIVRIKNTILIDTWKTISVKPLHSQTKSKTLRMKSNILSNRSKTSYPRAGVQTSSWWERFLRQPSREKHKPKLWLARAIKT